MKIVFNLKSGKSFKKDFSQDQSSFLVQKKIGDKFDSEPLGFSGSEFEIRGGSDKQGFPMRKDFHGSQRKKILLSKGVGFRGKLRKKRFSNLRIKKNVAGNTVSSSIVQLNVFCLKGEKNVLDIFSKKEETKESKEEPEKK